jgi:hypothetical protein
MPSDQPSHRIVLSRNPEGLHLTLNAGEEHTIIVDSPHIAMLEIEDQHFRTDSAVLLPEGQNPNDQGADASKAPPNGIGVVATCLSCCRKTPANRLLITGNTDTKGGNDYNSKLSTQRAACVHSLVVGDKDEFGGTCKARGCDNDKRQILEWASRSFGWPCAPSQHSNNLYQSTLAFQKAYNHDPQVKPAQSGSLAEDGDFGPLTWGAVFDCYEYRLAADLGTDRSGLSDFRSCVKWVFPDKPAAACGEFNTIDRRGVDNLASETNRRVEILFFEPETTPHLPCRESGCRIELCDIDHAGGLPRRRIPLIPSVGPGDYWIFSIEKDEGLDPNDFVELKGSATGYGGTVPVSKAKDDGSYINFPFFPGPDDYYDVSMSIGGVRYTLHGGMHLPQDSQQSAQASRRYDANQEEPDAYAIGAET